MKVYIKYAKIFINLLLAVIICALVIFWGPKVLGFAAPLIIGWLIAGIANPLVRMLEKRVKILRKHSSVMIIISVIALVIVGGYFLVVKVTEQVIRFIDYLPAIFQQAVDELNRAGDNITILYGKLPINIQESISNFLTSIPDTVSNFITARSGLAVAAASNIAKNIPNIFILLIFTLLSAYFFIAEREQLLEWGRKVVPARAQEKWSLIVINFKEVIGKYFLAQFKIMGVVAIVLLIGFLILRIEFSFIFAILIAILDALPFFGTGTALIPWAIVKFLSAEYTTAIGLVAIYGLSQLVRQIIQPKILGDSIGLSPMLSLIFMFIGYRLYGVMGMILAVPAGVVLINLFQIGIFNGVIENIKVLIHDFNQFRKQ